MHNFVYGIITTISTFNAFDCKVKVKKKILSCVVSLVLRHARSYIPEPSPVPGEDYTAIITSAG